MHGDESVALHRYDIGPFRKVIYHKSYRLMPIESKPTRSMIGQLVLYALLFLSGVAGLGYEIVWTRMFAVGLGHEVPSMLAVVAAFLGGLAFGAWILDRPVSRSLVPGRWYAALEVLIGVWALATIVLVPWANSLVGGLTGVSPRPLHQWVVAFAVPFVVLLPATAAMGATLPAMDRLFCSWRDDGRSLGGLYAANTFGAVFGVVAATFFCVPWLGYRASLTVFAVLNLSCALVVATMFGRAFATNESASEQVERPPLQLGLTLLVTGLLGVGYEVLGVRVMAQVLENTVYSLAAALAVYLLCTAVGAAAYQALAKDQPFERLLTRLLVALCTACLFGVLVLSRSRWVYDSLGRFFGDGMAGAIAAEMGLALLVFGPPTCLMGATFTHLAQVARRPTNGVGRALAVNTFGAALAAPIFAVWLLPALGAKWTLVLLATAYLTLIPRLGREVVFALIPALVLLFSLPANLVLVQPMPGGQIVTYREGVMAAVAVVTDDQGDHHLKVNDRFRMGGTASQFGERRQGHIPLLLHPEPRSALFLGLGSGITFASAADHPRLTAESVELVSEVVDVLPYFQPVTGDLSVIDRLSVHIGDARRFVAVSPNEYDVIVADLFHPARDGSGTLYTREHFDAVRRRLTSDGIFCQWLPLYQMDLTTLRAIVRTFLTVFPDARAYLLHFNVETPAVGLIASRGTIRYPAQWLAQRAVDTRLSGALQSVGLPNDLSLFGCLLAAPDQLRDFSQGHPVNTDNHPVVNFFAPRFAYEKNEPAHHALNRLLDLFEPKADPRVGDEVFGRRLADYVAARNLYLRAEMQRADGNESKAIECYLASVRKSREFRIGYTIAVSIAQNHAAAGDLMSAEQILAQLIDADPSRHEAPTLQSQIRRHR